MGGSRAIAICIRDHLEIPRIVNSMSGDFKYRTDIPQLNKHSKQSHVSTDCGVDVEKANNIVSAMSALEQPKM